MKTKVFSGYTAILFMVAIMTIGSFAFISNVHASVSSGDSNGSRPGGQWSGNWESSSDAGGSGGGGGNDFFGGSYGAGSHAGSDVKKTETRSDVRPDLTDIMARIQALLAQIKALKEQLAGISDNDTPGTGTGNNAGGIHDSASCRAIQNLGNFRRGMSGPGVRAIQQFLATEGALDKDNVTGYFGTMTEQALQKWQREQGVVSSGSATTTGYGVFGAMTRAAMYRVCENGDDDGVAALRVSPSQGKAPLTVELAGMPAEVLKKMNECKYSRGFYGASGNGLTITWGDGVISPQIPANDSLMGDSCTNAVKKHTYTKPGTYTVTVRSWHPGPTDAPITDWQGTARVVVTDDEDTKPVACTADAMQCSDGSWVGRTGPSCQFVCPTDGTSVSNNTAAALKARTALASKLDAFTTTITIKTVMKREWSDSCLGLGGAAESCLTVMTPGYRVSMEKGTTTYYARTNSTGSVVRFEE